MPYYIVNKNTDERGYHEVHDVNNCRHLPHQWNQEDLGYQVNCKNAVMVAKVSNPHWAIDGCKYCCPECHNY